MNNDSTYGQELLNSRAIKGLLCAYLIFLPAAYLSGNFYGLGLVPTRFVQEVQDGGITGLFLAMISLLRYQFFHVSFSHLFGNSIFLIVLGLPLEKAFGARRFITAYLLAGILSGLGFALLFSTLNLPMIGASGAVSYIVGVALVLNRNQPLMPIPGTNLVVEARHIIIFWLLLQLFGFQATLRVNSPEVAEFMLHFLGVALGVGTACLYKIHRGQE